CCPASRQPSVRTSTTSWTGPPTSSSRSSGSASRRPRTRTTPPRSRRDSAPTRDASGPVGDPDPDAAVGLALALHLDHADAADLARGGDVGAAVGLLVETHD